MIMLYFKYMFVGFEYEDTTWTNPLIYAIVAQCVFFIPNAA